MARVGHSERDIAFSVDGGFVKRLRKVIADSGETINGFACSLGYDRHAVYYWLSGEGVPNADALATMCRVYGIDPGWLLMGEI